MGLLKHIISGVAKAVTEEPAWKYNGFNSEKEYEEWRSKHINQVYDDDYEDCEDDEDEDDDYDDGHIPAGCRACGGDYPRCCDACPMFDD